MDTCISMHKYTLDSVAIAPPYNPFISRKLPVL